MSSCWRHFIELPGEPCTNEQAGDHHSVEGKVGFGSFVKKVQPSPSWASAHTPPALAFTNAEADHGALSLA